MPSWYSRPLSIGDEGRDVEVVQRKLGARISGVYQEDTARRVRGVQRKMGLLESGEVDTETAEAIGERADVGLPPEWFTRTLRLNDIGEDVAQLRDLLGLVPGALFTHEVEDAVRRFQSSRQITPTGVVDTALILSL